MTPDYILVDIKEFILKWGNHKAIRSIQEFVPIHMLISCVLAFNQYTPDNDSFWHLFENRCGKILDQIDFNVMEIFLESFTLDLDECIRRKVPRSCDTGEYILKEWVDGSIILLSYDESSRLFKEQVSVTNHHQPIYQPTPEQLVYLTHI